MSAAADRAAGLALAREAKSVIRGNTQLREYLNGIGITRADGAWCVKVNLERTPPETVLASFPHTVTTSGGLVRVVYDTIGRIGAALG